MTENTLKKKFPFIRNKSDSTGFFYIFLSVTKNPIQHAFEYVRNIIIGTKTNKLETT